MENELFGEKKVVSASKEIKFIGIGLIILGIIVLVYNFLVIEFDVRGIVGPLLAAGIFGYFGVKILISGNASLYIYDNGMIINQKGTQNIVMFSEIENIEYKEEDILPSRKINFQREFAYLVLKNRREVRIPFFVDSNLKRELLKIKK